MKLKIENQAYDELTRAVGGEVVYAVAINDNVSTSRHDANHEEHCYESRHTVMRAFLRASASRIVTVVSEKHPDGMRARVSSVDKPYGNGIVFGVNLRKVATAKAGRGKSGAK